MKGGRSGPNEDSRFLLLRLQLDTGRIVVDLAKLLVC